MKPASAIVNQAMSLLRDETQVLWAEPVVLDALNEAQRVLDGSYPAALTRVALARLEPGARQNLPVDGRRLIKIVQNVEVIWPNPTLSLALTCDDATVAMAIDSEQLSFGIEAIDAEQKEVDAKFIFKVTRIGKMTAAADVGYEVTGERENPASGDDFMGGQMPTGILHFEAQEYEKTISIQVSNDAKAESDERFYVTLKEINKARLSPDHAEGIIKDDSTILLCNFTEDLK